MDKEKRRNKRKKEENRVEIERVSDKHNSSGETIAAFSEDISLGGIKIITDQKFQVNSLLNLKISLRSSRRIIFMRGRVCWIKRQMEKGLYEVGVEFIDTSPNRSMILISHLYSVLKDQS
jgi:c-di-GMP-binding flagellar brake protein YcgR